MTDTPELQDEGYFSEDAATFGDRVAAARGAMGLTQESLSQKLGVKLKTLRSWEDDMSEPRANKLQMLAGILNISLVWLLTGEGEGVSATWDEDEPQNIEMSEIIADFRALRAENKRLCEKMLKLERRILKTLKQ